MKNKKNNKEHVKKQVKWILFTTILMSVGLFLFKYLPIYLYGKNILYDASIHVVFTIWILYILWFFIDQNKTLRVIYLILAAVIITITSIQRIFIGAHNEVGVMLGLGIAIISIIIPRWKEFKGGIKF